MPRSKISSTKEQKIPGGTSVKGPHNGKGVGVGVGVGVLVGVEVDVGVAVEVGVGAAGKDHAVRWADWSSRYSLPLAWVVSFQSGLPVAGSTARITELAAK